MNRKQALPLDFTNDFLSLSIRPAPEEGPETVLCCFSINLSRFRPLSEGRYGICSNPAFKGLQLLRASVSAYALDRGAKPRKAQEQACSESIPRGQGWYHETLLIDDVADDARVALLSFSVRTLVEKVLSVCIPSHIVTKDFTNPVELQEYIVALSARQE